MIVSIASVIFVLFLGSGWSLYLLGKKSNWIVVASLSFLVGSAIFVLSWSWLYSYGATVDHVGIGVLFISCVGWFANLYRIRFPTVRLISFGLAPSKKLNLSLLLLSLLVISFAGLYPKMDSPINATMTLRTGPDAIGNSIAVDALLNDGSKLELQTLLLSEVPSIESVDELLNSSQQPIYSFSSFSAQVKGEFIIAGLRLGLSGISASILNTIGERHLWNILAVLPTTAVLFGVLIVVHCLYSNNIRTPVAYLVAIGGALNVNLLHGWHEGGLAQAFVFLSTAGVFSSLYSRDISRRQRFLLSMLSAIIGLVCYSDWFIIFLALMLINLVLNFSFRQFDFARGRTIPVFLGYVFGFLLCGPYATEFIRYIPRRLSDSAIGGWSMPVWASPAEIFGVYNSFNTPFGVTGYAGMGGYLVFCLNMIFLGFLGRVLAKRFSPHAMVSIASISALILLVFLKSRFLDNASNYQYFKSIGLLAPLFFPLIALSIFCERPDSKNKYLLYFFVSCSLISSANYILTYRTTSLRIPYTSPSEVIEANSDGGLDDINLIGRWNFVSMNLSPFMDLRLINRPQPIIMDRLKSLGFLLNSSDCPNWECIKNVNRKRILDVNADFKILKLSQSSFLVSTKEGRLLPGYEDIVDLLSNEIGGPSLFAN